AAVGLTRGRREGHARARVAAAGGAGAAAGRKIPGGRRRDDAERSGGGGRDPQRVGAVRRGYPARRDRAAARLHGDAGNSGLGAVLDTIVGYAGARAGVGEHDAAQLAAAEQAEALRRRRAARDDGEVNDPGGTLRADPAGRQRRADVGEGVVAAQDEAVVAGRHPGQRVCAAGGAHRGGGRGGALAGAAAVRGELDVQPGDPGARLAGIERTVVIGVVVDRAGDRLRRRREGEGAGDAVAGLGGEREARARATRQNRVRSAPGRGARATVAAA